MSCDDIEKTEYVLKQGTILYSGNKGQRPLTIKDIFQYTGQRGLIDKVENEFVLYASRDYNTAFGYAQSCQLDRGYVHKFRVTKDVLLYEQPVFEDYEEVSKCVCPEARGIVVIYTKDVDEYGLCTSEDYLEYIESIDCQHYDQGWVDLFESLSLRDIVDELLS